MNALLVKNGVIVNAIVVDSIEQFAAEAPVLFASFDFVFADDAGLSTRPWIDWTTTATVEDLQAAATSQDLANLFAAPV